MMNKDVVSDTELVYAADRFEVRSVEITDCHGRKRQRQIVVPSNAVVILPLLDDSAGCEQVVLIRNQRFAVDERLWELPAGTMEAGESAATCADRELLEETGYKADKMSQLLEFYPSPGFCTELLTAFLATELTYQGQQLDETERITTQVVSLAQTMQMIRRNDIRDAKTIATLLYYCTLLLAKEG
jgi:ADP-ribose pyrophosphatase